MTQPSVDLAVFDELKVNAGADFVGELLDAYADDTPALLRDLERALPQGDLDSFRRAAHSIKASSASFGAQVYAAQARELEMMAKAGDLSGAAGKVAALVADFPPLLQRLRELQHEP